MSAYRAGSNRVCRQRNATAASHPVANSAVASPRQTTIAMTHRGSTVIPCLRYRDAHVAIDRLCHAFGLERHAVHAEADIVHHARPVHGSGMIMPGSTDIASESGKRMVQPGVIGNRGTQSRCVVVADIDAHHEHAKAPCAQIELDIADHDYGGRGDARRDIEGRTWWFGSHDPWAA